MPTFEYKGYKFKTEHTPGEDEFAKMAAYVDTLPPKEKKAEASMGTSIKSAFAGAMNTMDKAFSALDAYIAPGGFGIEDAGFAEMDKRTEARTKAANPNNETIGMAGKVVGALATLPAQVPAAILSPFETGQTMINSGESLGRALGAVGAESAGNAVGMALPAAMGGKLLTKVATGAGMNAAADYGTKTAIQQVAQTEKGKKAFEPTLEDAAVAGIVGGAVGGVSRTKPQVKAKGPDRANAAKELMDESADRPSSSIDEKIAAQEDAALVGRLTELDKNVTRAEQINATPEFKALWDKAVASGDAALIERLQKIDEEINTKQDNTQSILDQRQREMEMNVARQAGLDFNAAERARQENATNPSAWAGSDGMAKTAEALAKEPVGAKQLTEVGPTARPETILQNQMLDEVRTKAVEDHPNVRAAVARVTKQEELLIKMAEMQDEGRVMRSQMERAKRDLANLEEGLDLIRKNVSESLSKGEQPGKAFPFKKGQRGAVNPEVFKEGFQKLKQLADGSWLKAEGDGRYMTITAVKDSKNLGYGAFETKYRDREGPGSEQDLVSGMTDVVPDFRGQGYATEIYKFAAEMGNDIVPSRDQTASGKAMWDSFEKKGMAKGGYIPKGQRGALFFGAKKAAAAGVLNNIDGINKHIGDIAVRKATADETVDMITSTKDVDQNWLQKAINYGTKGGLYQSIKTKHPMIKYVFDQFTTADRLARADIRDQVYAKLGAVTRELNTKEQADIWALMNVADLTQKPLTREFLTRHGYNEKQINLVEAHREVMDYAFQQINKARAAAGKDPISPRKAYAAMRSTGDFRRLVYKLDEAGEKVVVGVVGSDFRKGLNNLKAQMEEKGFIVGEERYFGGTPRERGSANQAFQQAIEWMADQDPRVAEFLNVLNEIGTTEAYNFLNAKTHTMQKKGVFGMEGRKTWEDAEQNAKDGLQQQLNYAEAAIKWGHFAEAATNARGVMGRVEGHDNAKKWSEKYIYNALGYNPSSFGRSIEEGVAQAFKTLGVGYSIPRHTMAWSRKIVNTSLLGLNPAFWTVNVVQPLLAMPGMKASLEAKGLSTNFDFGTGWSYVGKGAIIDAKRQLGKLNAFEKEMESYAHKYHVYGSDLVEHSNKATKDFEYAFDKVGNAVSGSIESSSRRVMFYGFSSMLKDNGMSPKNGLFEAAHNLTDMAMNNYSSLERPQMYNSMGPVGDLAVNLQSFKHNELSRISFFARQIAEDKSAKPLLVQLATGVAAAGITGSLGFAEADQLYKMITKLAGAPDSLTRRVILMSEKNGMGNVASHGLPSLLGVDLSKRLGLSDVVPDDLAAAVFPGGSKIASMAGATYDAVKSPTEMNLKRAARELAPGVATGPMDRTWFSKDVKAKNAAGEQKTFELGINRNSLEGQVYRNDADKAWKNFGFQGINESTKKTKLYETEYIQKAYAELRAKPLKQAADELFTTGKINPETIQKYLKYEGDIKSLEADLSRYATKMNMPEADLALLRASMGNSVGKMAQAKRLLENNTK